MDGKRGGTGVGKGGYREKGGGKGKEEWEKPDHSKIGGYAPAPEDSALSTLGENKLGNLIMDGRTIFPTHCTIRLNIAFSWKQIGEILSTTGRPIRTWAHL